MTELLSNNNYEYNGLESTIVCINFAKITEKLFNRKLIRCKTWKKAINELFERYESISWTGDFLEINVGLKTRYQESLFSKGDPDEYYESKSIRILCKDYARLKTLAAYLRVSMSLLLFWLITLDIEYGWVFRKIVKRDIIITKTIGFTIIIIHSTTLDDIQLNVNSPP